MPKKIDTDALFETAVTLFAERGYAATTTQEIARRAGINEVTLFRRYTDKATLIGTALKHCLVQSPFGHVAASDNLKADLKAIVEAYRQTFTGYGGAVLTLLVEMSRYPELRETVSALMPNMEKTAGIIAHHQQAGRLGAGEPLQKLVLLIAPVMVSGIIARSGAPLPFDRPDAETLVEAFLNGHVQR